MFPNRGSTATLYSQPAPRLEGVLAYFRALHVLQGLFINHSSALLPTWACTPPMRLHRKGVYGVMYEPAESSSNKVAVAHFGKGVPRGPLAIFTACAVSQ